MRKTLLLFALLALCPPCFEILSAQSFYNVTFNNGAFPAGWTNGVNNNGRIFVIDNANSFGYFSSPTSPEASGEENVIFQHCAPSGSTVTLTVSGVVSTVGRTGIRVGFGRRATNAWNRPVLFEWSSNGSSWNEISDDVSDGASTTWGSIYFDLPSSAENVANLRFRFSYITNRQTTVISSHQTSELTTSR
ncbi:MAG: hypothetical protein IPM98_09520 [Lewinellaceae bacterium]|nr:hypothetical protein [Lewinellaceae bacterium]